MKYLYNATEQEIYALSQNYNIADLARGDINGKGSLKLRKIENRLRAMQHLATNSAASDIKLARYVLENKSKSKYWKCLMNDTSRSLIKERVKTTKSILEVYLNPAECISGKNERIKAASPASKENLETIASAAQETNPPCISRGKAKLATIALMLAMGLSFLTGSTIQKNYDNRILREKEKRIEHLVQESRKPRMVIKTDMSEDELDQIYEKYAADKKAGRLPVLDLTQEREQKPVLDLIQPKEQNIAGEESTEDFINRFSNNGVFLQGYMHATNRMQAPPEFSEKDLKEKERLQKKWANIGKKIERDTKKIGDGLHDLATFEHPFGGLLRAISGFGGILNASARGFARPITYFFTRSDTIDKAIDDVGDASYFGDSYNELHGNILGLRFQETGDFIREHPIKSAISRAEDILPFLIQWGHGGDGEGSAASSTGTGNPPGRSGGPGAMPGRGGGAGSP